MITLSIQECIEYVPLLPIDYNAPERQRRTENINMVYDLLEAMKNTDCLDFLQSKTNIIPKQLMVYFENYFSEEGKSYSQKDITTRVRKEYNDLDIKIENFATRWGYTKKYILDELMINGMLILQFAKDPGKQTFHQHYASEYIKKYPFVEDFKELTSGGGNALYIINGIITEGKYKKDQQSGKSIDFYWQYTFNGAKLKFYATHKYTNISGGSQDNQYKDVKEFHEQARQCINPNIILLSITDGPYYLQRDTSIKQIELTKLQYLKRQYIGSQNIATRSDELAIDVIPKIVEWLTTNFDDRDTAEETEKLNILLQKYMETRTSPA